MSEIDIARLEELKIEWSGNDGMLRPSELYEFCKLLLSSLEKEKEKADKFEGELNHVDMVFARRSALDGIPGRVEKILHAIEVAKKAEERVKELEPDAFYLRRYREVRGKNPEIPCACVIDEDGQWIKRCAFHETIVEGLEEKVSELDDRIEKLVILIDEYAGRITKEKERVKELEEAIQQAQEENPDEQHCTCVPLLKVKIKELEAEIQQLRAIHGRLG